MPSFNRDGVKRRLVQVFSEALPSTVTVSYEWPGDDYRDSFLYFDAPVSGEASTDSVGAARGTTRQAVDRFSIEALLASSGHYTAQDAERAAGDLMRTVFDTLRRFHRLKDPTGAIGDGSTDDYAGVRSVEISTLDGPAAASPQPTDDGYVTVTGMCRFVLTCTSDL